MRANFTYFSLFFCILLTFILIPKINSYPEYHPQDLKPPPKTYYISNPDSILTQSQFNAINENLQKFEKLQVGVLIISKMSSSFLQTFTNQDTAAQEFSKQVFDHWGIGDPQTNNGLLIFMSIYDRKFRIVTGKGAREIVSDSYADSIFASVKPYLKNEEYAKAIETAVSDVQYYSDPPNIIIRFLTWLYELITALIVPFCFFAIVYCLALCNSRRPINIKRADFNKNMEKLKELQKGGKLNEHFVNTACGICLQEFEKSDTQNPKTAEYVILVCGHNFHKDCLESWLKTKNMCPFCKTKDPTNPQRENVHNDEPEKMNAENSNLIHNNNVLNRMVFIQRHRYPEFYNDYSFSYENNSFSYRDTRVNQKSHGSSGCSTNFSGGSSSGGGGGGGSW